MGRGAPARQKRSIVSGIMAVTRKIALRVNGVRAINARVRSDPKGPQLVILDPWLEEFAVDESSTLELLELVHTHEIRNRLPNDVGG